MANVVVVGAQWGDEGKGKIVDWLSNRADVIVRFQGGHNAGHTLVVDGKVYKLALLPSGVVQGKPSIIGNGVVVDPWHLVGEIEKIEAQGIKISPDVLIVADNACLILPIHPALDVAREAYSHEVSSAGFWPGGGAIDEPAYYSYAYPAPEGFAAAKVAPDAAFWSKELGEFVLPYDAVRTAKEPERALMAFLQSTYEAAADLGKWDRAALECGLGERRKVRAV